VKTFLNAKKVSIHMVPMVLIYRCCR